MIAFTSFSFDINASRHRLHHIPTVLFSSFHTKTHSWKYLEPTMTKTVKRDEIKPGMKSHCVQEELRIRGWNCSFYFLFYTRSLESWNSPLTVFLGTTNKFFFCFSENEMRIFWLNHDSNLKWKGGIVSLILWGWLILPKPTKTTCESKFLVF